MHLSAETVATFIAKVGGDPIPNVKWMKGKWRQLNQGGRIIIQQRGDEAKLEIKDTIKTDSGMYKCVAFNQHGEIERSVNLQVEERKKEVVEGDLRAKLKRYIESFYGLICYQHRRNFLLCISEQDTIFKNSLHRNCCTKNKSI